MKELSIEEKAKRYDEAIERAKRAHNSAKSDKENDITDKITEYTIQLTETIFPELKESEDERIRKELLNAFQESEESLYMVLTPHRRESFIAWLEKQGGQKPTIIIPTFRVGDEIKTSNEESLTITKIDEKGYWSEDLFICDFNDEVHWNLVKQKPTDKVEPKFKVGDIIRFKGNETLKGEVETHKIVGYDNELYIFDDGTTDLFCEQDLYELVEQTVIFDVPFGANDSELVEATYHIPEGFHAEIDGNKVMIKKGEQKPPQWSEEDESCFVTIQGELLNSKSEAKTYEHPTYDKLLSWFDSLKNRCLPQPKQEWNKDDKNMLTRTIGILGKCSIGVLPQKVKEELDWLKTLEDRCLPQPKQEWSEEDEDYINDLIKYFSQNEMLENTKEDIVVWLKSLRPQSQWKPSDEQLKSLQEVIDVGHFTSYPNALETLYEQLKKLKS